MATLHIPQWLFTAGIPVLLVLFVRVRVLGVFLLAGGHVPHGTPFVWVVGLPLSIVADRFNVAISRKLVAMSGDRSPKPAPTAFAASGIPRPASRDGARPLSRGRRALGDMRPLSREARATALEVVEEGLRDLTPKYPTAR